MHGSLNQAQQLTSAGLLQLQAPDGDGAGTQQEAAVAAGTPQQELAGSAAASSYARRVLQTPVSGKSSWTSSAAVMSPTRAATTERTCS
jgi:hypothetical protein